MLSEVGKWSYVLFILIHGPYLNDYYRLVIAIKACVFVTVQVALRKQSAKVLTNGCF